jgi:hypothetical protein
VSDVKTPATTKMRQRTISGPDEVALRSSARPSKPPAKAITSRQLETLDARTARREATPGEEPRMPQREKLIPANKTRETKRTRAGKRAPRHGRAFRAADERAKGPSRRAGNRGPDASARRVPVTRRHKGSRGARG